MTLKFCGIQRAESVSDGQFHFNYLIFMFYALSLPLKPLRLGVSQHSMILISFHRMAVADAFGSLGAGDTQIMAGADAFGSLGAGDTRNIGRR